MFDIFRPDCSPPLTCEVRIPLVLLVDNSVKFLGKKHPNRILLHYLDVSHSRGKWAPTPEDLGYIVRQRFFNCYLDRFFVGCIKHSNVNVP
jgi:hypothetical protein